MFETRDRLRLSKRTGFHQERFLLGAYIYQNLTSITNGDTEVNRVSITALISKIARGQ
jgi:hypothetical protein